MASAQTARSGGFADDPLLLCLGIKFAMDSLWREVDSNPRSPCGGWRLGLFRRSYGKFRRANLRFAPDSPLEGDGFELPVPVRQAKLTRFCR